MPASSASARPHELTVDGVRLSGLLAKPVGQPRALVVALHGHGMTARYFTGPADAALSLLELGAALGFVVWAPDRPGYGTSTDDPALFPMFPQAELLARAIDCFAGEHDTGAGCVLLGHSFGLKLALAIAASPPKTGLLGVDGSGTGVLYTAIPGVDPPVTAQPGDVGPSWGPRRLYPRGTFRRDLLPVAPVAKPPPTEAFEWLEDVRRIGPGVRVPLRFTFGEHERLWRVDDEHFAAIRATFPHAPVTIEVLHGAGHNLSLSTAGRAYHLRALAFAEECATGAVRHTQTDLTVADLITACRSLPPPTWQKLSHGHPSPRRAATLVPIVDRDGVACVVVTKRSDDLDHGGDWVFPGGRVDDGDASHADAARREAAEELGLTEDSIEIIGQLNTWGPIVSGYIIETYIAVLPPQAAFDPDPSEVVDVAVVPVAELLAAGSFHRGPALIDRLAEAERPPVAGPRDLRFYRIRDGEYLWGLQGDLLHELLHHVTDGRHHF